MIKEQLTVGLVVERRALTGPWGGVAWRPVAVFPVPPEVGALDAARRRCGGGALLCGCL